MECVIMSHDATSDHSLQLIITDMAGVKPQLESLKCYDLMKIYRDLLS